MTPPDYDDLCAKLRELYVQHGTNYVQAAAEAIESLREQVAALQPPEPDAQKKIVSEMADDYDRMGDPEIAAALRSCLTRADKAEADNAALRQDAERYRWLRSCMWWRTDSFTQDGENIRTGYWQTKLFRNQLYGNLDAAIDATILIENNGLEQS